MRIIYLTNSSDNKPRRQILVDEFSYTVSTPSGESSVTLPGSRTYDTTNDHMVVYANGIKINVGVEYLRSSSTQISCNVNAMFPDGKFPDNCVLDFELFTLN
jgi:hypothetical protein